MLTNAVVAPHFFSIFYECYCSVLFCAQGQLCFILGKHRKTGIFIIFIVILEEKKSPTCDPMRHMTF